VFFGLIQVQGVVLESRGERFLLGKLNIVLQLASQQSCNLYFRLGVCVRKLEERWL